MDPRGQLQPQLRQDEQLLWQGGPDPLVRFSRIDAILLYLVVAYTTGVAFLWYVAPRHAGSAGSAVAALYTAVWLYWPLGRFIYRLYAKSRTAYAVTSTRALIVGPQRSREMPLRDAPVKILQRDSRHVTLNIGSSAPRRPSLQFESVADAEGLLAALAQAGARPLP